MTEVDRKFSTDQEQALAFVLDEIIPPSLDGRLPGAGQVGVARYIESSLRSMPVLFDMIVESLSALDDLAVKHHAQRFVALDAQKRAEVVNALAMSEHAFPPIIVINAFAGYYQQPRILEALGLPARPPHPKGYEMEADDPTLLDPVRRRPKMYRQA